MNQLRLNLGTSYNPKPQQIYAGILQHKFTTFNRIRRLTHLSELSLDDFCKIRYGKTVYDVMTKDFDRKKYYLSKSNYNNNKKPIL